MQTEIDYTSLDVPTPLNCALQAYLEDGLLPGNFLAAVLSNNLRGAVVTAEAEELHKLTHIVQWLWTQAPYDAWGSVDLMHDWAMKGGLKGIRKSLEPKPLEVLDGKDEVARLTHL